MIKMSKKRVLNRQKTLAPYRVSTSRHVRYYYSFQPLDGRSNAVTLMKYMRVVLDSGITVLDAHYTCHSCRKTSDPTIRRTESAKYKKEESYFTQIVLIFRLITM